MNTIYILKITTINQKTKYYFSTFEKMIQAIESTYNVKPTIKYKQLIYLEQDFIGKYKEYTCDPYMVGE